MNPGPPCICGNAKDARAEKCSRCYNRRWSAAEDAGLAAMIADGKTHKEIGQTLNRSAVAVRSRAAVLGLKQPPGAHQRNRIAAVRAYFADPRKLAEWLARPVAPETRAKRSASASARNVAGTFGVKGKGHRTATKRRMSATRLRKADARLNFAPRGHPLRELYQELVHRKHFSAAEAMEIVRAELSRMTAFERQMLRVQAGAKVVNKAQAAAPEYEQTLGGVSEYG